MYNRMKWDHSYTTPKINSKWINDLNIRPEAIKFLEENMKGKLPDNELLTPKAKANKWDYIKLKSLCIANHKSDKGCGIYWIIPNYLQTKSLFHKHIH